VSALVPEELVTRTLSVPVPAGLATVQWFAVAQLTLVPAFAPKATPVTSVKFEPVIVTTVPPAAGPDIGLIWVTTGGETASGRATRVAAARPGEERRNAQTAKAIARTLLNRVRLDIVSPPGTCWAIRFRGLVQKRRAFPSSKRNAWPMEVAGRLGESLLVYSCRQPLACDAPRRAARGCRSEALIAHDDFRESVWFFITRLTRRRDAIDGGTDAAK
jgi:hypothetical protein